MKTVIVFDHPYTAKACKNELHNRSFTAALCESLTGKLRSKGNEVDLIDLHADCFDPVMSREDLANWRKGIPMSSQVADYQQRIRQANQIVFMFPVWWELMPAMTKGFVDKVYAKSILYTGAGMKMETALCKSTKIAVVTVMGTPKGVYSTVFGKPVIKALQRGTFAKTGLKDFTWKCYSGVDKLNAQQRAKLIDEFDL